MLPFNFGSAPYRPHHWINADEINQRACWGGLKIIGQLLCVSYYFGESEEREREREIERERGVREGREIERGEGGSSHDSHLTGSLCFVTR